MSTSVYFLTMAVMFGTIIGIFGMKYGSAAYAARARLANDTAYQALAEKSVTAQAETQASLVTLQAELSKTAASLAAVEKILKQVE
jgi:hypothetical protein